MTQLKKDFNYTELDQNLLKNIPEETLNKLEEISAKLNQCYQCGNIARAIGTTIEIVGGLATMAGLLSAPFTFGLSVGLSFGGLLLNTTGLLTNISGSILTSLQTRRLVKQAQRLIQTEILDKGLVDKSRIKLKDLMNDFNLMTKAVRGSLVIVGKGINNGIKITELGRKTELAVNTQQTFNAVKILSKASKLTMLLGMGASALLLSGDFVQLVDVTYQLRTSKKSSEANRLDKVIYELRNAQTKQEARNEPISNECKTVVFVVYVYGQDSKYK